MIKKTSLLCLLLVLTCLARGLTFSAINKKKKKDQESLNQLKSSLTGIFVRLPQAMVQTITTEYLTWLPLTNLSYPVIFP